MLFKLKNIGKIAEAEIKLDGITVICGDNNTGKSTVGKALFSFFNSVCNYRQKINDQKYSEIEFYLENNLGFPIWNENDYKSTQSFISKHQDTFTLSEVSEFFSKLTGDKLSNTHANAILKILNTTDEDILNEYVFRFINSTMNGQIKNAYASRYQSYVKAEFKNGTKVNTIKFYKENCSYTQTLPITHRAYYINNPFVIDKLNVVSHPYLSPDNLETNVIAAIRDAQNRIERDKMTNIINVVSNKKDLQELKDLLKQTYNGETVIKDGKYFYQENGIDFDFRNISTGLKSFALIERLLELGILKKEDVLILDEPEIHLHSEWQIKYAKLIVMLQKKFDLTILIVTHSFQFLEALNFFMKKYDISDRGNYYTPEQRDNSYIIKEIDDSYGKLLQNLSKGTLIMADMEYEYEMKQENINSENENGY